MSCSASSNLQGNNVTQNPTGIPSRLLLNLDGTSEFYDLDAGITNGDAIRFEPTPFGTTGTYRRSQANNNENSEVVGVVESIDSDGSLTVVLRGTMTHPSSNFEYNEDVFGSTLGASGGNDIFFLSDGVSGGFMNLAPTEPGTIAKPVLQRMTDSSGSYNFQVLNYIGYQIGGDLIAETQSSLPIGSFVKVPETSLTPNGWLETSADASSPLNLSVTLYPDYYVFAGKTYGYIQTLILNGVTISSALVGATITQNFANGVVYTSGLITSVNASSITVQMSPSAKEFTNDTDRPITITLATPGQPITGTVKSAVITSVMVPSVADNSPITFSVLNTDITPRFKTIIKVRDVVGVSIPTNVTVKDMTVLSELVLGNTYSNVSSTLDNIISRIETLESQINGAS
mgnify:FL=1